MADTVAELGRIDSVFVNAGVEQPIDELRRHDGRRVAAGDGASTSTARSSPPARRCGTWSPATTDGDEAGGSIVFTTSGSAFYGQQNGQNYGASKAGVNAMMKGIAVQHARHGIRCNSVLPGWIESEMTAPAFGWDKFVGNVMPRVPMRRWGTRRRLRRHRRVLRQRRRRATTPATSSPSTAATTPSDASRNLSRPGRKKFTRRGQER